MTPTWAHLTGAALAVASVCVWWLRRNYRIVSVVGPSMLPTYTNGERVIARRRGAPRLRVGDVVVFGDPARGRDFTIKRVAALPGDTVPDEIASTGSALPSRVPSGRLVVLGDNRQDSLDSRQLGMEQLSRVYGVVLRRLERAQVGEGQSA